MEGNKAVKKMNPVIENEITEKLKGFTWEPESFMERLDRVVEKRGLSYKALSRSGAISYGMVSNWRCMGTTPTAYSLRRLCVALDVSADFLLGLSDKEEIT